MRKPRLLTVFAVTLCGALNLAQAAAADQNIYLAPSGTDTNRGTTPEQPVLTLARAQDIAITLTQRAPDNITIHIAPGTYREQKVVWHYIVPRHRIQILGRPDNPGTVIFDGNGKGGTFFNLKISHGRDTKLTISGITVTRYTLAINLNGSDRVLPYFNKGTSIISNRFIADGGYATTPPTRAVAVIRLVNSRDNTISNNIFDNMRSPECELLHAIYLAHHSSNNIITHNNFTDGCGDPIRARDASNYNKIYGNTFKNAGDQAAYSEWFCSRIKSNCSKPYVECPSFGNAFYDNIVSGNSRRKAIAPTVVHQRPADPACQPGPPLATGRAAH